MLGTIGALGVIGLLVAVMLVALVMLVRNQCVYRFRMELIDKISTSAQRDIASGNYDWGHRYEVFHSVPYERMVWQFWKPLRAFYPDMAFCERALAPARPRKGE